VEDEAGLHVGGHTDADRHGPYKKLHNQPGETKVIIMTIIDHLSHFYN